MAAVTQAEINAEIAALAKEYAALGQEEGQPRLDYPPTASTITSAPRTTSSIGWSRAPTPSPTA